MIKVININQIKYKHNKILPYNDIICSYSYTSIRYIHGAPEEKKILGLLRKTG